ncbi:MAG: NAD-dependent epimerase/dehydratase family protein [Alphaproteobacteria bacterium]|jgi:nucleoside-diphosphate-sugar epimerase|nr:NAD-dependent epimerase/dehydratase family protein [Alphaproteobacteria bacterium]
MLLVTGALGHSGRYFFEELAKTGYDGPIRAVIHREADTTQLDALPLSISYCSGDLKDPSFLKKIMTDVHTVLHIAGIQLSERLVTAGKEKGVERFILVHTTGRFSKYRQASADYIRIEDKLIADNPNLTILRPTMIYGSSRDKNIWKLIGFLARHRFFPLFGSGQNLMQPVHARDLAKAYLGVLTAKEKTMGKQYNLPGAAPLTYRQLLEIVATGLNKKIIFLSLPLWLSVLLVGGARLVCLGHFPISVEQVLRMNEDKAFSWEEAAHDFGYAPQDFATGIQSEIKEYLLMHTPQ